MKIKRINIKNEDFDIINKDDYFFSIDEELNDEKEFVVIYKEKNSGWLIYPETKEGVSQSEAGEIRNTLSRKPNVVDSKIINKDGCFVKVNKMNNALYSSLKEDYDDEEDSIKLTRTQIRELNKICQKYCGYKLPEEVRPLWDELEEVGVDPIVIMGYPTDIAEDGGKSWEVPYKFEGKDVINSIFVYQVYEGNGDSLKNDYNIYFS